ncbi:MAG: MtrB/PioB family outer membrane beta-barrel protein [Myxococcota bacterium]
MRGARICLLLAIAAGALPAAADPPRDSVHEGNAEIYQFPDPQGLSLLLDSRRRSPSGLLYPYPPALPELSDLGDGWFARGALESGYDFVSGDHQETRFTKYVDRKDGFLVDGLNLELWRPESGDYAMLRAGSVGREDQFYDLEADRAGWLRFRGSFSGVPHKYASDATTLWNGGGSDFLALPPGLTPGASSAADIAAALAAHSEGTLEVQRDRTQLQLRVRALPSLSLVAQYGLDDRKGAIPTGVGFAYPDFSSSIGATLEVPSPIHDQTHSGRAALEWSNEIAQASLAYNVSLYRNQENSLTLQQPFDYSTASPDVTSARLALPPDNDWHNVRADAAVNMPLRSRVTTAISWSRSTQNQDLLPPTISSGTVGATNLADWNTGAALSTQSAHARVDQVLVDIGLQSSPWQPLRLRAGYRFTNQDTQTNYTAFNPQTGQYGYIVEDGGHAAVLGPDYLGIYQPGVPGSAWRYRTIPFGESHSTYDVGGTYTAPWRSSLDLLLEQEDVDRDVSERPQTRERRATVSVNTRALSFVTARFSYKFIKRDGGPIDYSVYAKYTTQELPGFVPLFPDGDGAINLNQMVRPSLADLDAQRINGRLIFALGDYSDLSLSGRIQSDDYGSSYGLTSNRTDGVEADWTVQPSPALSANVFVSLERHDRSMQSIRGFASSANGDAGGPNFPFTNQWGVRAQGDATGWGGGLTAHPTSWIDLDTKYTFIVTHDADHESFASQNALANVDPTQPIPSSLPTLTSRDQAVETSARFALHKGLGLRFFYRYVRSGVDDFHQTGLPTLIDRRVYLGHADADYAASFFGVAVQVSFGSGW